MSENSVIKMNFMRMNLLNYMLLKYCGIYS